MLQLSNWESGFSKFGRGKNIYKNHQKSIVGASPAGDFFGGNVAVEGVK